MEIILTNENKDLTLSKNIEETLVKLDREIKEREEQYNSIKTKLLEYMRENGIKNISSDKVSVSYTEPYKKIKFNEKSFKKDNEELYNDYCELSDVKESIRITVKKGKKKEENILDNIVLDIN
jgi:hypothetical protein